MEQIPEMTQDILESFGIVLGAIIATLAPYIGSWIKNKLGRQEEAKAFVHNAHYRALINEVLVEIRTLAGANRAAIVEYHNGSVAINGLPFNYASMTYEKTDNVTKDIMLHYQRVPISIRAELLLEVHNSKDSFVKVDDKYSNIAVKDLNKYFGVETCYIFRITDHVKDGTVHLMWSSENAELSDEQIYLVKLKVMYIRELISKMKKY